MLLESVIGAVVGKLGVLAKEYLAIKRIEKESAHERAMLELEMQNTRLISQGKIEVAEVEVRGRIKTGELNAMAASYSNDKATYGSWIDYVRGLVRPVVTIFYTVLSAMIVWKLDVLSSGMITASMQYDLMNQAIGHIFSLTGLTAGWWFGAKVSFGEKKK